MRLIDQVVYHLPIDLPRRSTAQAHINQSAQRATQHPAERTAPLQHSIRIDIGNGTWAFCQLMCPGRSQSIHSSRIRVYTSLVWYYRGFAIAFVLDQSHINDPAYKVLYDTGFLCAELL